MPGRFVYDVAISFAGEDRHVAQELAAALEAAGVKVFYDDNEKAALWGKDLYSDLTDLYRDKAQFCIMLISQHYASKVWPTQERRAAQARALSQSAEYILPIRLDETEVPGLLPTTMCLRWDQETGSTIASAVQLKLRQKCASLADPDMKAVPPAPTIRSFQLSLDKIYGKVNNALSPDYMYGHLARTAGYLSKNVSPAPTAKDFIRPMSWLASIASTVGCDLQEAFISRYPRRCPYCIESHCVCFRTNKEPPEYIPAYKMAQEMYACKNAIIHGAVLVSLDFAKNCIASIYPSNEVIWHYAGPWFHFSKLAEEVAEVHEALSGFLTGKKNLSAVSDEIADVLAWILGAWHITLPGKSVDQEIISYYLDGCPVCRRSACVCKPYSGRPQNLFDPSVLSDALKDLAELSEALPAASSEIEELQKSLTVVIETQNYPLARITLHQVAMKLGRLREACSGTDKATTSIPIIVTVLNKLELSYRQ
jgi:hypothetical protein